MRKKFFIKILIYFIFLSCFYGRIDISKGFVINVAYAEEVEDDIEKELYDEVNNQITNLDFSAVESLVESLNFKAKSLFSSQNFSHKVLAVINGDYIENSQNFFSGVGSIFFDELKNFLPIIASIISIAILGGMIGNLKPVSNGKSIGGVVHFATYGIIVIFLGGTLVSLVKMTTSTLFSIKGVFDGIFPVLMTLLTALGGSVSVGIYQPAIGILGNLFVSFVTYLLLPMFIFSIVFSLVGNLSDNVKLEKFVSFLQSSFKWIIGLCFTIFLGFVSIQGILAGSVDGLSIRTAKFALKSYVPIVGGYVSDGMSIILASSNLIKNAVGGVGLFLLLSMIISPILSLVLFSLSLKFMSGIIEPVGDKKIANFVSEMSKNITLLVALLIAVAFMYFVLTGLILASANYAF